MDHQERFRMLLQKAILPDAYLPRPSTNATIAEQSDEFLLGIYTDSGEVTREEFLEQVRQAVVPSGDPNQVRVHKMTPEWLDDEIHRTLAWRRVITP